ncbi:MAG: ribosome-binding factor A [Ilumatobacteraceae bacterium]|jgi:ribosome-binding factor A|nr:ribosome-binding factor A [Ilumatobacteraceae bacterium]
MARQRRRTTDAQDRRRYERTARLSETLREVIAEELAKLDDDRLTMVTITSVDVDSEMNRGIVYFDSIHGADNDEKIVEVLGEYRKRLQHEIALQVKSRRTPVLQFKPDETMRAAERIDAVLREDALRRAAQNGADGSVPPAPPTVE